MVFCQWRTQLNDSVHEKTIICGQLFADHVVGSRLMKRKKNSHRKIMTFLVLFE